MRAISSLVLSAWTFSRAQALPDQFTKPNNSFMDCESIPILAITANILAIITAAA